MPIRSSSLGWRPWGWATVRRCRIPPGSGPPGQRCMCRRLPSRDGPLRGGGGPPARPARPRCLAAAAPTCAHRTAQNLSDTGSGAHDDGATGRAGGDAVADRNLLSGRQAAAGPGGLRRTQLDRLASPHDSVSAGPLFPGAAETPAPKKAPALTGPPMCRLLAASLPRPRSRLDHTLQILGYQGARNPAATRAHALRRRNRGHPP